MRGVLAPIPCLVAALALAGCMGRTAPVAMAPQSSLDTIAFGQSYADQNQRDYADFKDAVRGGRIEARAGL